MGILLIHFYKDKEISVFDKRIKKKTDLKVEFNEDNRKLREALVEAQRVITESNKAKVKSVVK